MQESPLSKLQDSIPIIAASTAMQNLMEQAKRIAPTDVSLFISGESGTGKDLLARWIHEHSKRASKPYVKIDCATLPELLLEAELFGYERGAFTSANISKLGRLEAAQGGTLVFDEIIGLSLQAQAKLLRVVEERSFVRLGGTKQISLNVRFIALTNWNLFDAIKKQIFRSDLFHRLSTMSFEIPPLRERSEDILLLINHFINSVFNLKSNLSYNFTQEFYEALKTYNFPGNIRELFNILERAILSSEKETLDLETLPIHVTSILNLINKPNPKFTLAQLEAIYIRQVLTSTCGQKKKAAEILGISRKNLYEKMRAYNLPYARKVTSLE